MSAKLACGRPLPKEITKTENSKSLLAEMAQKLDIFVVEKNLNRSEAREKILETIVYEARHFTAQHLLNQLGKRFPEVGKATLYRNLPVLVESGIIQEGPTDSDNNTFYELVDGEHHDHIVCLDCRRIFEFHDEAIEQRQESITSKLKFTTKNHRHVVYAACDYLKR